MKWYQLIILSACLLITDLLHAQIKTKQEKGYFNITTIAEPQYLQSLDSSALNDATAHIKSWGISFSTVNGYFPNPNLSIGLGIGVQFSHYKAYPTPVTTDSALATGYFDKSQHLTLLPIFADFRYYPSNYRNDLMFILDVGYAPLIAMKYETDKPNLNGGALIKLGAGYKIELGKAVSFTPSLNFNAQRFGDNTVLGAGVALGLMF